MDLSRLTRGEQIVGGAGILLLILSFFPFWAKVEVGDFGGIDLGSAGTARGHAWNAFNALPKIALFLVLLSVILVIVRLVATDVKLPISAGQLYVGLSGLATLLLLIALLTGPSGAGEGLGAFGVEISRGPLLFIGWLLAAAMAYGGWMHMREEGTTPGMGPGVGYGPTAPPPGGGPTPPPPPPAS